MDNFKTPDMHHNGMYGLWGAFATVVFAFISAQTAQVWAYIGTGFAGVLTGLYYGVKMFEMIKAMYKKPTRKTRQKDAA